MNHLAHLALADAVDNGNGGLIVGGFLGDHVKGRLKGQYPEAIEAGIQLHRAIDAHTDSHPQVLAAQRRFPDGLRRYAGIITDILFDHLLAQQWHHFYKPPLPEFSHASLQLICNHESQLPETAALAARRMLEFNSLAAYGQTAFVERSLHYLGGRLKRDNPLAASVNTCLELLPDIQKDFIQFYPQLIEFSEDWMNTR